MNKGENVLDATTETKGIGLTLADIDRLLNEAAERWASRPIAIGIPDAAQLLGMSETQLRHLLKLGELAGTWTIFGNEYLFSRDRLQKWFDAQCDSQAGRQSAGMLAKDAGISGQVYGSGRAPGETKPPDKPGLSHSTPNPLGNPLAASALTLTQAADLLQVSESTLTRMIAEGHLAGVAYRLGKLWRIDRMALMAWQREQCSKTVR